MLELFPYPFLSSQKAIIASLNTPSPPIQTKPETQISRPSKTLWAVSWLSQSCAREVAGLAECYLTLPSASWYLSRTWAIDK